MPAAVYLDNQATTPVDPRVLDAMLPYFGPRFGNAASRGHSFGWEAEQAVELARRQVAELAGASPREIVFSSGATESDNLALKGVAGAHGGCGHILTLATEHKAVLDTARALERAGIALTVLLPRTDGTIDLDALDAALRPDTLLVSVMQANNEIGVVQPLAEIGAICRRCGVLFHTDAAQSFGKLPIDVEACHIDLLSASAHKIYGPKGVGALYVRSRDPRVRLVPQMDGGGHESGLRSGTLNVPGIVGFGAACAIAASSMAEEARRTGALRDRLLALLQAGLEGVTVNGAFAPRLPGNLNVRFAGVDAASLLIALPGVALSTGSACTSAAITPSHVLRALGLSEREASSSVRFGIGRFNTEAEMDDVAARVIGAVRRLRTLAPV
jgi:cysteine desulfurase